MLAKPALCRELYAAGFSTRQVAEHTGLSKSYVAKLVRDIARPRDVALRLALPATSTHWRSTRQAARRLWERMRGPIPEGHHIHHIDGDYTNNVIENLACLSSSEHGRLHHPANPVPRHLRPERQAYQKKYHAEYRARKKEVTNAT